MFWEKENGLVCNFLSWKKKNNNNVWSSTISNLFFLPVCQVQVSHQPGRGYGRPDDWRPAVPASPRGAPTATGGRLAPTGKSGLCTLTGAAGVTGGGRLGVSAESSMSGRSSDKTRTQDFEKTTDGGFWNLNFEKEVET